MGEGPNLSALTELAYAAALDDNLWNDWADEMFKGFGSHGGLMCVFDRERVEMRRLNMYFSHTDEATLVSEYFAGPVVHDPQITKVLTLDCSSVFEDTDHLDCEDPQTREYLGWQLAKMGTRHHLTAAAFLDETLMAGISLHRSPGAGSTPATTRRQLEALLPDVTRAWRLGFKHNGLLEDAWWDGVQSRGGEAIALIGEVGQILRLSELAEAILAAGDGIAFSKDRIVTGNEERDGCLSAALRRATDNHCARGAAISLPRPSGRKPYRVFIYPLVRKRRYLAPLEAAALVHIVDPTKAARCASAMNQEMFGLTPRESQVADLLLAGHSPESLAETLEISLNTARIHLRALYRKTETSRQSELVRTLLIGR